MSSLDTALLPVTVTADCERSNVRSDAKAVSARVAGHLRLESPRGILIIEGEPDFPALRLVLEAMFE